MGQEEHADEPASNAARHLRQTDAAMSDQTPKAVRQSGPTHIDLPNPIVTSDVSVEEAMRSRRSVRAYSTEALSQAELGQMLWAAQGVTNQNGYRTVPSAGAKYPLELYAVVGNVEGIDPGIYKYDPKAHSIQRIKEGDSRMSICQAALNQEYLAYAPATIAITAVKDRSAQKYGSRAARYVLLEAGAAGQNIHLAAETQGLGTVEIGAFDDDRISGILGLSDKEKPILLMPLGKKRKP